MAQTTELGKIENIRFGMGGYQDVQLGLTVTIGSKKSCWGVQDFKGFWNYEITADEHSKWTEVDRELQWVKLMKFVGELLRQAKTTSLEDLRGIPVEATFEGMTLKSWRILEEVL